MADLKTWNGVAKASVKTLNGLAVANWKSWNGILIPSGGGGSPAFIAATSSGAANTHTTSAIDTTGASLLVVGMGSFQANPTLSDSQGNSWTALTLKSDLFPYTCLYYCLSPSTSASHTVTATGSGKYCGVAFAAFSGVTAYDSRENSNAAGSGTSLTTGSVTPSQDNTLLVAFLSLSGSAQTPSINTSFTIATHKDAQSAVNYSADLAYLVQATAGATNPTWSWSSSVPGSTNIAVFK